MIIALTYIGMLYYSWFMVVFTWNVVNLKSIVNAYNKTNEIFYGTK